MLDPLQMAGRRSETLSSLALPRLKIKVAVRGVVTWIGKPHEVECSTCIQLLGVTLNLHR